MPQKRKAPASDGRGFPYLTTSPNACDSKKKGGSIIVPIVPAVKPGPKPGENRLSTRLACLLSHIGRCAPGRVVRIPLGDLADTLQCRRETLRKLTMRLRNSAWFFQGYHTACLMTFETSQACPRGSWVLHVVNRHSLHRIWAAPGKWRRLRWHQRQGDKAAWDWFLSRIKKWALAMVFRKNKKSDGKHKGFSPRISARTNGARAPGGSNRPAWRRFGGVAGRIQRAFDATPRTPDVKVFGWCVNRLQEWHSERDILRSLRHAADLLRKRRQTRLDNPAAWLCGVAGIHLASDGLVPSQRLRDLKNQEDTALPRRASKVELFEPAKGKIVVDSEGQRWQHQGGTHWEKIR